MKILSFSLAAALLFAQASFAGVITYDADLSGPAESPPNASPGVAAPEPATWFLAADALLGLGLLRRRVRAQV